MKAKVDQDTCVGCELCVQACPDVFKMQGDKATVSVAIVPNACEAACKEAAEGCPVTAISIEEGD